MRIRFPRWVWLATGISSAPIGRCDCDQDYCLTCEIKFQLWYYLKH